MCFVLFCFAEVCARLRAHVRLSGLWGVCFCVCVGSASWVVDDAVFVTAAFVVVWDI